MDDLPHILLTPMLAEAAAADGISGRTHAHGTGNVWLSLTLRTVAALVYTAVELGKRICNYDFGRDAGRREEVPEDRDSAVS